MSYADAYVVRLAPDGSTKYASVFSGRFDVTGNALALDRFGNATVTGFFTRDVDFNPHPRAAFTLSSDGRDDVYVARLSVSGKLAYVRQFGSDTTAIEEREAGNGLALSPDESLAYVAGTFHRGADFDPGPAKFKLDPDKGGSTDGFVMAVSNATGDLVWAEATIAGGDYDGMSQLAVGPDGSIYAAGYFQNTADVDPGPGQDVLRVTPEEGNNRRESTDLIVEKLVGGRSGGAVQWVDHFEGNGYETVGSLAVDSVGSVYLAGGYLRHARPRPGPGRAERQQRAGREAVRRPQHAARRPAGELRRLPRLPQPQRKVPQRPDGRRVERRLPHRRRARPRRHLRGRRPVRRDELRAVRRVDHARHRPAGGGGRPGDSNGAEAALLLAGLERPVFAS